MYLDIQQRENSVVLSNVSKNHLTEATKQDWLTYWKHFKRKDNETCAHKGCSEKAQYGILVKEQNTPESQMFVVPVCKKHSSSDAATLDINTEVDIIAADLVL